MSLPPEVQNLINHYLREVQSDLLHHLGTSESNAICEAFGPSKMEKFWDWENSIRRVKMSEADRVRGWLGVLTARRVVPIWEQAGLADFKHDEIFHLPAQMLEVTEGMLLGTVDADMTNDFHYWICVWGFERQTTQNVYYALSTAYSALCSIFYGDKRLIGNFASEAVKAYSTIDENKPGRWWGEEFKRQHFGKEAELTEPFEGWEEPSAKVNLTWVYYHKPNNEFETEPWWEKYHQNEEEYKPIKIDLQKRLEFWEWWLTKAIRQAWELAQE